ncbi:MAG: hypothetical protein WC502_03470 [Methanolinea sp.]|jgi:hypothetical protein
MKNKHGLILIIAIDIAIVVGFILTICLVYLSYCFHEAGHIVYGFLNNLVFYHEISSFEISNWVTFPLFPFLKVPQQTHILEGRGSLNLIFGGIITVIIGMTFVCYLIYQNFTFKNKKWVFAIPIYFVISEIIRNYFCGTDNLINSPDPICNKNIFVNYLFNYEWLILWGILIIMLLPNVENLLQTLLIKKSNNQ